MYYPCQKWFCIRAPPNIINPSHGVDQEILPCMSIVSVKINPSLLMMIEWIMLLTIHLKASYNALHPLNGSWGLIAASIQNGWQAVQLHWIIADLLFSPPSLLHRCTGNHRGIFSTFSINLFRSLSPLQYRVYIIKITPLLKELLSEITNIKWHVHCTLYTSNGLRRKMLTLR